jgi:DNA-binding transcriptional LysR family regulator
LFKEAPGITLNFRTGVGTIPKEGLEKGEVDLVVSGIYETLPDGFYRQKLLIDHYRSAVRRDHPLKSVSAEEFAQLSHVLVTPRGDLSGVVDQALLKIGKKRKVAVGSASFLSAALAVTETDFVFSAPGLLIERLKDLMQLRDFETPLTLPRLDIYQVWHARTQSDPALKWMRQRFLDWCKPRTDRTPGGSK